MKQLFTINELLELSPKDEFTVVKAGFTESYTIVGPHPSNGLKGVTPRVVAIPSVKADKAEVFSVTHFNNSSIVVLHGKWDAKHVGAIMIEQLKKEINTVKKVYIDSN